MVGQLGLLNGVKSLMRRSLNVTAFLRKLEAKIPRLVGARVVWSGVGALAPPLVESPPGLQQIPQQMPLTYPADKHSIIQKISKKGVYSHGCDLDTN
jgi:hypothetical protein